MRWGTNAEMFRSSTKYEATINGRLRTLMAMKKCNNPLTIHVAVLNMCAMLLRSKWSMSGKINKRYDSVEMQ